MNKNVGVASWGKLLATVFVVVLVCSTHCLAYTAGDPEFRAFWVDAWHDGILSQPQVDALLGVPGNASSLGQVRDANCNAVIIQVRRNCDAAYPSGMSEPYMSGLSPATFNGLQAAINAAHDTTGGKKRIEVHAWMVTFRTSGGTVYGLHDDAPTGSLTNLDNYWPSRDNNGAEVSDKAFDPGHPLAEDYTVKVAMDVVKNFDVDGIHFDYIRFTANNQGYNPTSLARYNARYGLAGKPAIDDVQWQQWRRDQVTSVVRKVYAQTQATKPSVKVSGSFVTWNPSPTASTRAAFQATRPYYDVYSDWDSWMQEGIVDAGVPMTYYDLGGDYPADWTRWIDFEKDRHGDRHMYIGPGIYMNSESNAISEILQTRSASPDGHYADGFSGYSYFTPYVGGTWAEFSPQLVSQVTGTTWAPVPDMPWKSNPTKGHISGTVTHFADGKWADGATVTITGPATRTMLCDGTGFYAFIDLPTGTYTVTASQPGYPNAVKTVNVLIGSVTGNIYVTNFDLGGTPVPVITNVQASGVTTTSASISWNTDQSASSRVEYGPTSGYGSTTTLDPALVTSHSASLTGLTLGTVYHYRVISGNGNGSATSTDYTFATVGPPAISSVAANSITNSSASIAWNTDQAASSQVQYGLTTAYGSTTTLNPAMVTAHSVPVTGLAQNTLYHYCVTSGNVNGTTTSGDRTFTTDGPPTVSAVQVMYLTSTSAMVTWSTNKASDSKVNYGLTNSYGSQATNASLVTSHSVTITGLSSTTTYHYQCISTGAYGTGTSTDLWFTTPGPPTISSVSATAITAGTATITWSTDQATDSRVNYGLTGAYGSLQTNASSVTSHSVTLSGLAQLTTYHYQCVSTNANGTATSDDYTFTTTSAPAETIVDDPAASYTTAWTTGAGSGYLGGFHYASNRGSSSNTTCTWTPNIAVAGNYNVYCCYPTASNNTTHATYTVYYNGGNASASFNQTIVADNLVWKQIAANVPFAAGTGGRVALTNATGESRGTTRVVADAVRFVYVAAPAPPAISGVTATAVSANRATITWTTDLDSSSIVEYGLTSGYGSSVSNSSSAASHSMTLTGLTGETTYHYRVKSANSAGTATSADYTFTTTLDSIVDDVDPGATWTGSWTVGTYGGGYSNTYKYADGATGNTASYTWTPNLARTGTYDVYCYYTSGGNRTAAANYDIHYSGGNTTATTTQVTNGGAWVLLRSGLQFNAGASGYVTINNNIGTGIVIIADAIKWAYVSGPADTTPPTIAIGAPSGTLTSGGPISYTVNYNDNTGVSAIMLDAGNISLNKTGTANGIVRIAGSGTASRTVTISGITGTGTLGISIAAGTASDAAGNTAPAVGPSATFSVDNSAPITTSCRSDRYTTSTTSLKATWSAVDDESGIARYEYAVGTTYLGTDIRDWTNAGTATDYTIGGLSLTPGATYCISMRAVNGVGLTSDATSTENLTIAYPVVSIREAKALEDGRPIGLPSTMVVSAEFPNMFYLEDANRVAGIRVESGGALTAGQSATVLGILGLTPDGERAILSPLVIPGSVWTEVKPFAVTTKFLGGKALGFTPGVTGGTGLNNTGLLVKVAGQVTRGVADGFYLDDGSKLIDDAGNFGVKIWTGVSGLSLENTNVTVTGPVSCRKSGLAIYPQVLAWDIVRL